MNDKLYELCTKYIKICGDLELMEDEENKTGCEVCKIHLEELEQEIREILK